MRVEIEDSQAKAAWEELPDGPKRTSPYVSGDIDGHRHHRGESVEETVACSPRWMRVRRSTRARVVVVDGAPWCFSSRMKHTNHPTEIEPFGGGCDLHRRGDQGPPSPAGHTSTSDADLRVRRPAGTGGSDASRPDSPAQTGRHRGPGVQFVRQQVGLATGLVDELYHPDYRAKHLELGAVIGAVPADHVVRVEPQAGDGVLLVGGRPDGTGDGGATGSSKRHDGSSLQQCGRRCRKATLQRTEDPAAFP
jgi:phosphoribosylformylglycinamidine synthase